MLQTIVCPNVGHSIIHHFGEGAGVWGQAITPSVAYLVQRHRELAIEYLRVRPGIVFEIDKSLALSPHVIDSSAFRLHVETVAFRHATGRSGLAIDAMIGIDIGADCSLKLWGRVSMEAAAQGSESLTGADDEAGRTIPIIFTVTFWEIARATDARLREMERVSAEKDRKIRELESKVAMSNCSQ